MILNIFSNEAPESGSFPIVECGVKVDHRFYPIQSDSYFLVEDKYFTLNNGILTVKRNCNCKVAFISQCGLYRRGDVLPNTDERDLLHPIAQLRINNSVVYTYTGGTASLGAVTQASYNANNLTKNMRLRLDSYYSPQNAGTILSYPFLIVRFDVLEEQ